MCDGKISTTDFFLLIFLPGEIETVLHRMALPVVLVKFMLAAGRIKR